MKLFITILSTVIYLHLSNNEVKAQQNLTVDFICVNYLRDTINQGYYVNYSDNSSGGPIAWNWDFGNGDTGNLQVDGSFFPYPGLYPVELKVTHSNGFQDSLTRYLYVTVDSIVCAYTTSTPELISQLCRIYFKPVERKISVENCLTGTINACFSLYDLNQKLLFQKDFNATPELFDVNRLKSGIYFYILSNKSGAALLTGSDEMQIKNAFYHLQKQGSGLKFPEIFGDGRAAEFICYELVNCFDQVGSVLNIKQ